MADCDLRAGLHAKRWFDAVGHYSREDVLLAELSRGCRPRRTCDGPSRRFELELEVPHHHLVSRLEARPLKLGDHADLTQPTL